MRKKRKNPLIQVNMKKMNLKNYQASKKKMKKLKKKIQKIPSKFPLYPQQSPAYPVKMPKVLKNNLVNKGKKLKKSIKKKMTIIM